MNYTEVLIKYNMIPISSISRILKQIDIELNKKYIFLKSLNFPNQLINHQALG